MSVATEFAPTVYIPSHYVPSTTAPRRAPGADDPGTGGARLATVTALHRPSPGSVAAPVRLTRRGVAVVAAAVALVCVGLVWLAWASAPASSPSSPGSAAGLAGADAAPVAVTVRSGDTLWSIATRVAPGRDPRAEVAQLQSLNHLHGVDLVVGQVLHTR